MSALIHARVLERRAAVARAKAEADNREAFLADAKGDTGPQGEKGDKPDHQWKGTKLRFERPDGTWGEYVDLQGKPGKPGKEGVVVLGGSSGGGGGTDLGSLPEGSGGTPQEIAVKQGGEWVRMTWSQFIALLPAQGGEEVATYSKRIDFISESVFYRGEAVPGTAESAAGWRIARVTIAVDGDVTEHWAGGSSAFDKVWDDRAGLSYS